MGAGHNHGHGAPGKAKSGATHKRRLAVAFAITLTFFLIEAIAGVLTQSLALISDAGHMFTDVIGLGMAWAAVALASRPTSKSRTYGLYRLEVLAALANAVLLFGVAAWVLYEAVHRLSDPVDVESGTMLAVAVAGLVANLVCFFILRGGAKDSINVKGAYLEVLADGMGSVGVIIAAGAIALTDWSWIDPAIAVIIGAFILPRTWALARNALKILLEASPSHINVSSLRDDLESIPEVVAVHDLHVWTLTSGMDTATAHLVVNSGADGHSVLDQARSLLQEKYSISHATMQVEPENHEYCDEVGW